MLTFDDPSDQLRPFLDESAGGFVERLFEALEESRSARGNKGAGEKNRKRDLKVHKLPVIHNDLIKMVKVSLEIRCCLQYIYIYYFKCKIQHFF